MLNCTEDLIEQCPSLSVLIHYAMLNSDWDNLIAIHVSYVPILTAYGGEENDINVNFIKFINKEFADIELTDDDILKSALMSFYDDDEKYERKVPKVNGVNTFFSIDSEIRLAKTIIARSYPNITEPDSGVIIRAIKLNKKEIDELNLDENLLKQHFKASKMEYKLIRNGDE